MGCDIHWYVEARVKEKWVSQDRVSKEDGEFKLVEQFGDETIPRKITQASLGESVQWSYIGRNYVLFAVLANVRNGSRNPVPCIVKARGLPKDISTEVKAEAERTLVDSHTHSWLLLSEILNWKKWDDKLAADREIDKHVTIKQWCRTFCKIVIPKMEKLRNDPKDVRAVFWFDS